MLFALCCFVEAQQLTKVPRIGYVAGTSEPTRAAPDVNRDAFRQGLRDLGYIEGRNIVIEYRYAAGDLDRTATLVADLIRLPIDVLVSPYSVAILAAKRATKTMPIVMVTNRDPIATGMVDSLARPGGNVTGLSRLTRELSGKRLELLKEVIPTISRVGIVIARSSSAVDDYAPAAKKLQIALHKCESPI